MQDELTDAESGWPGSRTAPAGSTRLFSSQSNGPFLYESLSACHRYLQPGARCGRVGGVPPLAR
jgi:hypothetical protein